MQRWCIHLGRGGSIREAPGLPVPLTRKMARYFLAAPEHFSPLEAIRYGQVLALGGDGRVAGALLGTKMSVDFRDDPFALELIRFFIRNPFLDKAQYAPIVDYIWNRKYENQRIFVERGVVEEREPAQPGFSMAGRTAPNLIRQMEAWHVRLGRSPKGGLLEWGRSPVPPLEMVEGRKEQRNMRVWRISELLRAIALRPMRSPAAVAYAQYGPSGAKPKTV